MERKYKLAHPVFILSVIILIVNDFYLKQTFHNTFTGKLSDFVGLFAFPFFWSILFPAKTKGIHILTGLLFLFWKSEFSQPLIDLINQTGLNTFRTVDYTDYIALVSVFLSYYVLQIPFRFKAQSAFRKFLFLISIFSFVATTQKRDAPTRQDNFKSIDITNQGNKKLTAIIHFEYPAVILKKDSTLNNEFNRNDTVSLMPGKSERIITPIMMGDSLKFPDHFKIVVLNEKGKEVKIYDRDLFFKSADTTYYKNGQSEYADFWSIKIGEKIPETLAAHTLFGRWKTLASYKKHHTFEIREQYYYDVDPDSDIAKYEIQDSIITIAYPKIKRTGRVKKLDGRSLTVKWDDKGTLRYEKLYD